MSTPVPTTATEHLTRAGLDLQARFDVAAYNAIAAEHPSLTPLPAFGRAHAEALLVGNTKALWHPFVRALGDDAALAAESDPLDRYAEREIRAAFAHSPTRWTLYSAASGAEPLVSTLRAAQAAGLAIIGPAHLAVHPEHGPWFGLRGIVVFDAPPTDETRLPVDVCAGCDAPCKSAFDRAAAALDARSDRENWRAWVAVRDSCPIGREARYGEDQLRYHYTKDRAVLDAASHGLNSTPDVQ